MAEDGDRHQARLVERSPTASSRAARSHGSGAGSGGAAGGSVSRRNCSTAAITAAASSGEADEPSSLSRGRRFTPATLPQTAHSPSPRMTWNGTFRFQSMKWFIVSSPNSTGIARSRTLSSNAFVPTRSA